MPADSLNRPSRPRRKFPPLLRLRQVSESHCGPAVLQILLARLGIQTDQERLTELAEAVDTIETQGTTIDQLALAVRKLDPSVRFWHKCGATLEDLLTAVSRYRYPVGVEWQGLFEDREEDEDEEGDYGHYSIVTGIDRRKKSVTILDPYTDFYAVDRVFPIEWFLTRWWDTNEVADPQTGQKRDEMDYHCMFVVTPRLARFPALLGMRAA